MKFTAHASREAAVRYSSRIRDGYVAAIVIFLLLMCSRTPAAATAPTPLVHHPASFTDAYQLLVERNIFDRNRRVYHPSARASTSSTGVQNPFTLTGLVREHGTYSAFIEDSRSGTTTKYELGDSVGGGKISAVGLDHIDFTQDGRTMSIALGQTLAGTTPGPTEMAGSSGASPTTGPSGNIQDILERLRQRRLQELHQ